ncbi:MAG: hypothetical protein AABX82_07905 [Nanoarchaeota archaeon]
METIVSNMETDIPPQMAVVLLLLKDFSTVHTITSIGKELGMTRSGTWKVLKRLEKENYIIIEATGKETSLVIPKLNFANDLLDKYLDLALSKEAMAYGRWSFNFKDVKEYVSFFVLYGSILNSYTRASDIDVIGIINDRINFKKLHKTLDTIQKTEAKHIHAVNFTQSEFKEELVKQNKAFIEAIKKGVILFGQNEFITFMRRVHGVQI